MLFETDRQTDSGTSASVELRFAAKKKNNDKIRIIYFDECVLENDLIFCFFLYFLLDVWRKLKISLGILSNFTFEVKELGQMFELGTAKMICAARGWCTTDPCLINYWSLFATWAISQAVTLCKTFKTWNLVPARTWLKWCLPNFMCTLHIVIYSWLIIYWYWSNWQDIRQWIILYDDAKRWTWNQGYNNII